MIFGIMSPKGGCGKSTTTLVLASALAENGDLSVAIVDADPRQSIGRLWKGKREENNVGVPPMAIYSEHRETEIVDFLEELREKHDVIFVDLEGVAGLMSSYVAGSANICIVPMRPSALDGDAAGSALRLIGSTGKTARRKIPAFVLITQTDAAIMTTSHREVLAELDDNNIARFQVELIRRAPFERMMSEGRTIFELEDTPSVEKARRNARALVKEVVDVAEATL